MLARVASTYHRIFALEIRSLTCIATLLLCIAPASSSADSSGAELLQSKCVGCHALVDGGLHRIKDSRRTPEGWDMTLVRMMIVHGVSMTDEERAALVKHLADTLGLAPEETQARRYILERRPNMVESQPDETLAAMCARCHSYARFALQRRTRDEWLKLAHFHLGQFPTTEYQAMGRDRNWWEIASSQVPDLLVANYPFATDAWSKWRSRGPVDLSGGWRVAGHQPGRGGYHGVMTVDKDGVDQYSVKLDLEYMDGEKVSGTGRAIVYTGYEWRASIDLGGKSVQQVATLDGTASGLSGRWYFADNDVIGADLEAARSDGGSQIMAVHPSHIRAGHTTRVTVHGTGLSGDVSLGDGVAVTKLKSSSEDSVVVLAVTAAGTTAGARTVSIGSARADSGLTVYQSIDTVRVEPPYAIARVGGDGGPLAPVPAQFDAVAYSNGADGKAGTDDDVRIGVMPAKWSVQNSNEVAAQLKDTEFAGSIDADHGLFTPANAGPNPKRPYSTNNAGDLTIKASVEDQGKQVEGSAHLVVTVQRWIDPPIR